MLVNPVRLGPLPRRPRLTLVMFDTPGILLDTLVVGLHQDLHPGITYTEQILLFDNHVLSVGHTQQKNSRRTLGHMVLVHNRSEADDHSADVMGHVDSCPRHNPQPCHMAQDLPGKSIYYADWDGTAPIGTPPSEGFSLFFQLGRGNVVGKRV